MADYPVKDANGNDIISTPQPAPGQYAKNWYPTNVVDVPMPPNMPYDMEGMTFKLHDYGMGGAVAVPSLSAKQIFGLKSDALSDPDTTFYLNGSSGSDSNNGLSSSAPFASLRKTIQEVNASGGSCKVVIQGGTYDRGNGVFDDGAGDSTPDYDTAFVAQGGLVTFGAFDDDQTFTRDATNTNVFSAGRSNVNRVLDLSNMDDQGLFKEYLYVPTIEDCNATPDSWTDDGSNTNLHINRADGDTPVAEGNIRYLLAVQPVDLTKSVNIYFGQEDGYSGFEFYGGGSACFRINPSDDTEHIIVAENVAARYAGGYRQGAASGDGFGVSSLQGVLWCFNCDASMNAKDGYNVHNYSGDVDQCGIVTVNCRGYGNGAMELLSNQSANALTAHEDCFLYDFAGRYGGGSGGAFRSIGSSFNFLAGTFIETEKGDRYRGGSNVGSYAFRVDNTAVAYCYRTKETLRPPAAAYVATSGASLYKNTVYATARGEGGGGLVGTW